MVIFISGSINSGKSTIAKLLSQKIDKPALVEIDVLSGFIDWLPIEEKIQINLENGAAVINNFIRQGFNIIVPYPLSKYNYDLLLSRLDLGGQSVHVFILNPELSVALSDRGGRELTEPERARIRHHYDKKINDPGFGEVIDNSRQSAEESAADIFSRLR